MYSSKLLISTWNFEQYVKDVFTSTEELEQVNKGSENTDELEGCFCLHFHLQLSRRNLDNQEV